MAVDGFLIVLQTLTWEKAVAWIIDIVVTTALLYGFLKIVKDTRSRHMVVGVLVVVLFLQALAWVVELPTVSRLLHLFYANAVLIFVVLFQSDLRKALVAMGSRLGRMGREHYSEQYDYVTEIVEAVGRLALHKIGALIVLERHDIVTKLPEVMGGYDILAPVSRHLLVAIFQPAGSNTIHDGAVLVRNGRIVKAGVMLPLTKTPLPEYFGSRHKAALGITDISDAISLVVSEERGRISICAEGRLKEMSSVEELRSELFSMLQKTTRMDVQREAPAEEGNGEG